MIYASTTFPHACPPILAFKMGSLAFLAPFSVQDMEWTWIKLGRQLAPFGVQLRARLEVDVRRAGYAEEKYQVLNEAVISRGNTNSLLRLALFSAELAPEDEKLGKPVSWVSADGLIVSSPSGSTAYNLSAGGPMMHPSVPAMIVTPICPHSLSFRPLVIPDSTELRVMVDWAARNPGYLSLDGRESIELRQGDEFVVRFSRHPVPMLREQGGEAWLGSLRSAFHWNTNTLQQKPLKSQTNL